ncbi:MAG: hypothetical protein IJV54_13080 [Bacteroidales bacterium]|nr:hypothetical protein [Bacteroidales bacterium]
MIVVLFSGGVRYHDDFGVLAAGEFNVGDAKLASLAISGMVRWMHRWYSPHGRLSSAELCGRLGGLALNLVGCSSEREAYERV